MQKLILLLLVAGCVTGCSKGPGAAASPSSPSASSVPAASEAKSDAVQQKLTEFAGTGATDCGRLSSQADDQLKTASTCAMQAAQAKHPFYVGYDMPGMTVGVAGNAEGSLFTVQAQGSANLTSGACPSQLRVAPSGRVTCFAPGDMGSMGAGVHNGMSAPGNMMNPHAGSGPAAPPKHF
jgi:hypothetical protein